MRNDPWWERKALSRMTPEEWESLCDGCGKCCLIKLEDPDDGEIVFTDVACHLLDGRSCRCRNYANRQRLVSDCVVLRPETVATLEFMPRSCAYRLRAEGRPLYWWHPLVSGDPETVHLAGMSVRGRVVPEREVKDDDLEDHIVTWPVESTGPAEPRHKIRDRR
jgi:uncharacterized cysteine cluster protein YcgN (CxxCxxCC family)